MVTLRVFARSDDAVGSVTDGLGSPFVVQLKADGEENYARGSAGNPVTLEVSDSLIHNNCVTAAVRIGVDTNDMKHAPEKDIDIPIDHGVVNIYDLYFYGDDVPVRGLLEWTTSGVPSDIYIDGVLAARNSTAGSQWVTVGVHRVRIVADGYVAQESDVTVTTDGGKYVTQAPTVKGHLYVRARQNGVDVVANVKVI